MKILNFTIHNLTESQTKDGGIEPHVEYKEELKKTLLVVGIPTRSTKRKSYFVCRNGSRSCKRLC